MGRYVLFVLAIMVSGCSGSIYRSVRLPSAEPHAIVVDSRQRIALSQARVDQPNYRQYCAEPSPDVFTVLGVAASGGANVGLTGSGSRDVSAALQAAFSSSETGTTIARTQTIQMLREMMFRTCERYLSGAIGTEELLVVAARDQRLMVSILAIEQLTGAITPRSVSIGSSGSATTGLNPTEAIKLIADAQAAVRTAERDETDKQAELVKADVPAGNCEKLRKKSAADEKSLDANETTALAACEKAQAALNKSIADADLAKARYADLVAASKRGNGISTASTTGTVEFASDTARTEAAVAVAASVEAIVAQTFSQDEAQLMCIRTLSGASKLELYEELATRCLYYLMKTVETAESALASKYHIPAAVAAAAVEDGLKLRVERRLLAITLERCVADTARFNELKAAAADKRVTVPLIDPGSSSRSIEVALINQGSDVDALRKIATVKCN